MQKNTKFLFSPFVHIANLLDYTFDYFLSTMKLNTLNNSINVNIMIHNVCLRRLSILRYPKLVQTGRSYAKKCLCSCHHCSQMCTFLLISLVATQYYKNLNQCSFCNYCTLHLKTNVMYCWFINVFQVVHEMQCVNYQCMIIDYRLVYRKCNNKL